jgi:hypothetical protein
MSFSSPNTPAGNGGSTLTQSAANPFALPRFRYSSMMLTAIACVASPRLMSMGLLSVSCAAASTPGTSPSTRGARCL